MNKQINPNFVKISLTHLNNLIEASELSGNDIVDCSSRMRDPVTITIDESLNLVYFQSVNFPNEKPQKVYLSDYLYILSVFRLE